MPPVRRQFAGHFILLFASVVISLVLVEIGLRIKDGREKARMRERFAGDKLCTMPSNDSRLVYTFRPHECGANSEGYFDAEHTKVRPRDTFRIVIVGDSVAQGKDVGEDESFGRVLEHMLDSLQPFRRHEVIVLARMGYSTSQEIVVLEEEAFSYEPNLILWSYCLNDPAHPVFHNANGELGRFHYSPRLHVAHLVERALFTTRERIAGRRCGSDYHEFLHCVYRQQVSDNVGHIADIAAREGVPVAFLIHPVFERIDSYADYALRQLHTDLAELARRNGLAAIDLLPAFEPYRPDDIKVHRDGWYDPWHPNVEGHRIIAEYLFEALAAKGLI